MWLSHKDNVHVVHVVKHVFHAKGNLFFVHYSFALRWFNWVHYKKRNFIQFSQKPKRLTKNLYTELLSLKIMVKFLTHRP